MRGGDRMGMEQDMLWSPGGVGSPGVGTRHGCQAAPPVWRCPLTGSLLSSADLSQVEITRPYLAKQTDEISLQQADVVLVLGGEDGKCQCVGSCG